MSEPDDWERRIQRAAHPLGFPLLRLLSRRAVVRIPGLGVVISAPEPARSVISDPARFSKTGPGSPADLWTPVLGPTVLLNMDGSHHLELRRKLAPLFTPAAVQQVCRRAGKAVLTAAADRWAAGRPVDLVTVARDLTGAVICELVGLQADADRTELTSALTAASAVTGLVRLRRNGLTPAQVGAAKRAMAGLVDPAASAYRAAGDTIPGRMAQLGLTLDEAVGAVGAFALVGTETLVSFLPRLLALTYDAGLWPAMATDPAVRQSAVQEALRVTVPSPVMLRSAVVDTAIAAVRVRRGDRIIIATVSACRTGRGFDPSTTAAADLKQLWFGAGPHFCLGMPLAMAEIEAVLDVLLRANEAAAPGRLAVLHRQPARRVLIPGYRRLVVGPADFRRTASVDD